MSSELYHGLGATPARGPSSLDITEERRSERNKDEVSLAGLASSLQTAEALAGNLGASGVFTNASTQNSGRQKDGGFSFSIKCKLTKKGGK